MPPYACLLMEAEVLQYTVLLLSFGISLPKITLTQTQIYVDNYLAIHIPLSI